MTEEDTATSRALGVNELLEMVLSHLDVATLMDARRVCKTWHAMAESSVALQRRLFLQVAPTYDGRDLFECCNYNLIYTTPDCCSIKPGPIYTDGYFNCFWEEAIHTEYYEYDVTFFLRNTKNHALHRPWGAQVEEPIWYRMLLFQYPFKLGKVKVKVELYDRDVEELEVPIEGDKAGVRFRDVCERVLAVARQWGLERAMGREYIHGRERW
ncbi:hypothetical protein CLAFUW4_11795 [Fulvia fulva]|uniref:F-box domain-containing protein n=1 Tax=Passalora fulva TaxID=5499 RepID=A0A9Q8USA0_PASFU|nr:uncharacterized protein CLAFUR5_10838 [Fulvia fulva]KAK4617477.1 hypothetical protein CLAFUR4_11800 [Fulvia fulva]KAK4619220.1 hypothetical protein CLAFUR0_11813 [Fulvia fulva]UJO20560.1 hypothetical protein CLAFUR5_10838 [Fulvia fulva]WPV18069.1 hypothetical protein CLAFUW4_11795 [Fulvia fulva]WPV33026.1 hypothetical protein CLAFUW7_11802 [Fulvia fulva]